MDAGDAEVALVGEEDPLCGVVDEAEELVLGEVEVLVPGEFEGESFEGGREAATVAEAGVGFEEGGGGAEDEMVAEEFFFGAEGVFILVEVELSVEETEGAFGVEAEIFGEGVLSGERGVRADPLVFVLHADGDLFLGRKIAAAVFEVEFLTEGTPADPELRCEGEGSGCRKGLGEEEVDEAEVEAPVGLCLLGEEGGRREEPEGEEEFSRVGFVRGVRMGLKGGELKVQLPEVVGNAVAKADLKSKVPVKGGAECFRMRREVGRGGAFNCVGQSILFCLPIEE